MDFETSSDDFEDRRSGGERPVALILVVDDEPDTLAILQIWLSMYGFEAMTAGSAQEALRRVEERLPDLIITDCKMPRMSGLDLCRTLRARRKTRRIPIILHTAESLLKNEPQLYDHALVKPAEFALVMRTIQAMLSADRTVQQGG